MREWLLVVSSCHLIFKSLSLNRSEKSSPVVQHRKRLFRLQWSSICFLNQGKSLWRIDEEIKTLTIPARPSGCLPFDVTFDSDLSVQVMSDCVENVFFLSIDIEFPPADTANWFWERISQSHCQTNKLHGNHVFFNWSLAFLTVISYKERTSISCPTVPSWIIGPLPPGGLSCVSPNTQTHF